MEKQTHTAGEWTLDDNGIRAGDELIATAYGFVNGDKVEYTPEVYANARLISAAPDLLDVLRASTVCLALLQSVETNHERKAAIIDQIKLNNEALRKATEAA